MRGLCDNFTKRVLDFISLYRSSSTNDKNELEKLFLAVVKDTRKTKRAIERIIELDILFEDRDGRLYDYQYSEDDISSMVNKYMAEKKKAKDNK